MWLGVALAKSRFLDAESNRTKVESWLDADISGRDAHIADFHDFPRRVNDNSNIAIQNLTNAECITAYNTNFLDSRGPLLLISSNLENRSDVPTITYQTVGSYNETEQPWTWMCSWNQALDICVPGSIDPSNWTIVRNLTFPSNRTGVSVPEIVQNYTIDYCLSMETPGFCKLHYSLQLLAVVILANVLKAVAMLWTLFAHRHDLLITVGDAVSSFLDEPDLTSKGLCMISRVDVSRLGRRIYSTPVENTKSAGQQRWYAATGLLNWSLTVTCWLLFLGIASGLLSMAVSRLFSSSEQAGPPLSRGFGSLDARTFIQFHDNGYGIQFPQEGASGLIGAVLLVNVPQIICSFLYFMYNGLVTAMLSATEWSRYYLHKRGLRVSDPRGQQRSTYWLSLPYRYSLPLIGMSIMLHWLISQGLFLARVGVVEYDASGTMSANSSYSTSQEQNITTQAAYSCLPILLTILLATMMLLSLAILGWRKLHGCMPVVGSCSLAISAACHRPKDDPDAAYLPVNWGEIPHEDPRRSCHCCFTSQDVVEPCPDSHHNDAVELTLLRASSKRDSDRDSSVRMDSVGIPVKQWLATH